MSTLYWLNPALLSLPHELTHPEKQAELLDNFILSGWDLSKPALVAYTYEGDIQLLSGTHRTLAALYAGLVTVPVLLYTYPEVAEAYGNVKRWSKLMHSGDRVL